MGGACTHQACSTDEDKMNSSVGESPLEAAYEAACGDRFGVAQSPQANGAATEDCTRMQSGRGLGIWLNIADSPKTCAQPRSAGPAVLGA